MRILLVFWLLFSSSAYAFFWQDKEDRTLNEKNIDYWQPDTNESWQIPERPYDLWNYERQMTKSGLSYFKRIIPTFNKKGTLFASWTTAPTSSTPRPTIIISHGGHGITPGELNSAIWFRKELNANVLILDSFWSRGRFENHRTTNEFGVNTRVLDTIAAGRWVKSQPEVDPRYIYVYGGSQGGWLAMRIMTKDPFITNESAGMFKASFSLYPWCWTSPKFGGKHSYLLSTNLNSEPWLVPQLGPYTGRVYVFTGGKDTGTDPSMCNAQVFEQAEEWVHFPEATHGWDIPNRGVDAAVDGECAKAKNPLNRFMQCRSS